MKSIKTLALFLFVACFASCVSAPLNKNVIGNPQKGAVLVSFDKEFLSHWFEYKNQGMKKPSWPRTIEVGSVYRSEKSQQYLLSEKQLAPGQYEFYQWSAKTAYGSAYGLVGFSIPFNVHPGKITYIGHLQRLDPRSPKFLYKVKNDSSVDIANFLAKHPEFSRNDIVIDLMKYKGFDKEKVKSIVQEKAKKLNR